MRRFHNRRLEAELRSSRPEPPPALVGALAAALPARRSPVARVVLASALTLTMLSGLAVVGGLGHAATAVERATLAHVSAQRSTVRSASVVGGTSSGSDQYRPGFGFGDAEHVHNGPPGLAQLGPLEVKKIPGAPAVLVTTHFSVDEQAHLFIHLFGPDGKQVLITPKGSRVGGTVTGGQDKTIQYLELIPRVMTLTLRVPLNLVKRGRRYTINIVAVSPLGERAALNISFTA